MMRLWASSFVFVFVLRCFIVQHLLYRGDGVALVYAMFEIAQLTLSAWNAIFAKSRDYRLVGLAVPVCYMFGAYLFPQMGSMNTAVAWLLCLAFLLNCWSLRHLLGRVTVAASSWRSLVDRGPYRVVRHPQSLSRLLVIVAVLLSGLDAEGYVRAGLCLVMTFIILKVEEGFLFGIPDYVAYADRVRYRLLPFVY